MNFLKISGLIIGTGSVVGGTGAGVYYGVIKKTKFDGKLVFEKKTEANSSDNYQIKLLTIKQYADKETQFNIGKNDSNEKYAAVNKIIDISYELNVSEAETKLKEIFGSETTLTNAKAKIISEKEKELKELFGKTIYEKLKTLITT